MVPEVRIELTTYPLPRGCATTTLLRHPWYLGDNSPKDGCYSEAKAKGMTVEVAKFPWAASGRALTFDRTDGLTKLIVDPETERILGVGIVGHGAGEWIAEGVLAVEMGATVRDLAETVHPHPTLSETLMECAEAFYGHATHIYTRKKIEPA